MGNNIDKVRLHGVRTCGDNYKLLGSLLASLKEYFSSFKAICENFYLDLNEFEQIFSGNRTAFEIWDQEKNGLIDVFELFSGLVIFANGNLENKTRFLFEIFDINEANHLSTIDIEFMIYSCLNSSFKILGIKEPVNEMEITSFVEQHFPPNSEIKISSLIKFTTNSPQIIDFLKIITLQKE